jgi:hypothetical protein
MIEASLSSVIESVAFGLADSFGGEIGKIGAASIDRALRAQFGRSPSAEERGAVWDWLFAIEAGEV